MKIKINNKIIKETIKKVRVELKNLLLLQIRKVPKKRKK